MTCANIAVRARECVWSYGLQCLKFDWSRWTNGLKLQTQENISLQLSTIPHGASRFSQKEAAEATAAINARRVYAAGAHADGLRCALFDKEQTSSFTGVLNWSIKLNVAIQSPVTQFSSFFSRKFATSCYCMIAFAFAIYAWAYNHCKVGFCLDYSL